MRPRVRENPVAGKIWERSRGPVIAYPADEKKRDVRHLAICWDIQSPVEPYSSANFASIAVDRVSVSGVREAALQNMLLSKIKVDVLTRMASIFSASE
jgi:hypothetical protein